ncbi:decarboxylating cobalt-precorrin-6B (C(15))-methyltransferase [Secundilactobacillus hailunensis]|uniref:Decarboxylating cobalt-precorrin-6B (C(15))-methyltransferase n=1 Tax=Secundilactobacillus hailunensis TaxID=2559923 RepID=A0ABW1T9A1_9LACO|nr:decarboxylating cobalt-precorrin-6B (C(15))-methyltransferase [Secundilactobacillus hailunensis]
MKDEVFLRSKVPMTKSEVRALSIDKLRLQGKHSMLDIGSGTGSVSIQAALEFPDLQVTSVEHHDDAIDIMQQNMDKFKTANIDLVKGEAPVDIPDQRYDAIFVGGSGSNLEEIIDFSLSHLNADGTLVLNFILQENAMQAFSYLDQNQSVTLEMSEVRVSKWHGLGKGHYFKPQNPTLIISATRKE